MNYAQKGAIIVIGLVAILAVLGLIAPIFNVPFLIGTIILVLFDELLIGGSIANTTLSEQTLKIYSILLSTIFYALIGAFIGWIVGKVKQIR